MKLTTRCGSAAVDGLNEALLAKAAGQKLLRTAPAAGGHHGRAGECVLSDRLGAAGQGGPADRRDRPADPGRGRGDPDPGAGPQPGGRASGRMRSPRSCGPGPRRRRDEKQGSGGAGDRGARWPGRAGRRATRRGCWPTRAGRCAAPQAKAAALAAAGLQDAAAGRRRGRLRRAVNDLAGLLEVTSRIAAQARQRLAGTMPDGATRRVSLHEPDARPIAKGRLGKPVEFGYKAQVTDNDDGIVAGPHRRAGQPRRRPAARPGRQAGHQADRPASPGPSPPTAATARKPSKTTCTSWASATS